MAQDFLRLPSNACFLHFEAGNYWATTGNVSVVTSRFWGFLTLGVLFRCSYDEDYCILGSMLGSPYFGKPQFQFLIGRSSKERPATTHL